MYSDILALIRTSSERDLLLSEINEIRQSAYETKKEEVEAVLKSKVRGSIAEIFRAGVSKAKSEKEYFEGLTKELEKLSEIKMTLSFEPSEDLIGLIHEWLETSVTRNLVIDIVIDKHILGGAQISYKGKYFDGSLATAIDNLQ